MSDSGEGEGFLLARSASHLLHRAQQLASDRFASSMGADGITLRQFALLAALGERSDQTQSDLVRATGIDRSTLADMITRMEKRGLLARETAENDARAKSVRLTLSGQRALRAALPHALAADRALLDCLTKGRRTAFLEALQTLALIVGEPEAPPAKKSKVAKVIKAAAKATRKQAKKSAAAGAAAPRLAALDPKLAKVAKKEAGKKDPAKKDKAKKSRK